MANRAGTDRRREPKGFRWTAQSHGCMEPRRVARPRRTADQSFIGRSLFHALSPFSAGGRSSNPAAHSLPFAPFAWSRSRCSAKLVSCRRKAICVHMPAKPTIPSGNPMVRGRCGQKPETAMNPHTATSLAILNARTIATPVPTERLQCLRCRSRIHYSREQVFFAARLENLSVHRFERELFSLGALTLSLDSHCNSWHSSAHDYHPHPRDCLACWGCRPEPMGVAATARARSCHRVSHRGDGPWSWRYANPIPRDCVHARHARRAGFAVSEYLTNLVSVRRVAQDLNVLRPAPTNTGDPLMVTAGRSSVQRGPAARRVPRQ